MVFTCARDGLLPVFLETEGDLDLFKAWLVDRGQNPLREYKVHP